MSRAKIDIPRDQIAAFCQRRHIRRLALFGAVLEDDFDPEDDVDLLVVFEEENVPRQELFEMETELTEILHHTVALSPPKFLSHQFRDQIMADAEVIYAAV